MLTASSKLYTYTHALATLELWVWHKQSKWKHLLTKQINNATLNNHRLYRPTWSD